jgi:hypothetical protein
LCPAPIIMTSKSVATLVSYRKNLLTKVKLALMLAPTQNHDHPDKQIMRAYPCE